jgi:hypothetical protein
MRTVRCWLPLLLFASLLIGACAQVAPRSDPWHRLRQADGSVLWLDEYRFDPPPHEWQLLSLNDQDYSLALYKGCGERPPGSTLCQSTMAYAEEPFGHSRELEARAHEFLKRFLWASRVRFSQPLLTPTVIAGRDALVIEIAGEETVMHQRLQAKIVLMHRGERVVAFFINQWRDGTALFSAEDFATFDRFVASFRFVRPSFYETL